MALPALLPLLIGAGIGGFSDEENPLRGAVVGGLLGGLTGGLGAGAKGAAAGKAAALDAATTVGAEGVGHGLSQTAISKANIAAQELGKDAVGKSFLNTTAKNAAQSIAENPLQSLTSDSVAALTQGGRVSPVASQLASEVGSGGSQSLFKKFMAGGSSTDGLLGLSMLNSGQQSPTPQPVQQERREFKPAPSIEERLARVGGNEPLFVPKSLFEEERENMEEEELIRLLKERGLV